MLFDKPLASFTNNIIYINRPNNYKTTTRSRLYSLLLLKITYFHTPHNNFKTLPLPYKLQREMIGKVVSNTRSIVVFRHISLLLFFRDSYAKNRRRCIPAVFLIRLKVTEHTQQKESNIYHRSKPDEPTTYQRHLV